MRKNPSARGYTLLEMLIVIAIVALLATISFPVFGKFRNMAGYASCLANLRILHVGFNTYMQDHEGVWPQIPEGGYDDEDKEWEWWHDQLKNYGVARNHWVCPADDSNRGLSEVQNGHLVHSSSYIPTLFDEAPNTAFRWNQPWVLERGGFHKKTQGPNMLMPDGTIIQGPAMIAP